MSIIRYDVQHTPSAENEIQLIYCTLSRYDDTWRSIPHSHQHAELFYCIRGRGFLQIVDEKIPVSDGDFFLINPAVEHTESSTPRDLLEYIVVGVGGVRFVTPEGKQPRYCLLNSRSNSHELLPYFQDILRELSRHREGYIDICLSILKIILAKAGRYARVAITGSSEVLGTSECAEAKRLIDECFPEAISLDWLAERAHISKFYLSRAFHKHYGLSPMHYLTQRRLQEARHLLIHTDYSLSAICTLTGFTSPSYFSQSFKRSLGVTPSEYRRVKGASASSASRSSFS